MPNRDGKKTGQIPPRIFDNPEAIGETLAPSLLADIDTARRSRRPYLLGCPTGRTPRPIYTAIARMLAENPQDLSHLVLVMMDEYLVETERGFRYASADNLWSCHHFVADEIVRPWNHSVRSAQKLRSESIWFPDPANPTAYDEKIAAAGGIDFFILASGASDGHVAFNPPGSARESRTRIIELSEETRRDNLQTFPSFGTLSQVPTHGISVGIQTIAEAKAKAMIVWGDGKRLTLGRILKADRYESDWPATVIHEGSGGQIFSDKDAATGLFQDFHSRRGDPVRNEG
jgi:glucosamine-6-phosphate deaminase